MLTLEEKVGRLRDLYTRLQGEQTARFNATGDLVHLASADFAHDAAALLDYLEGWADTPPLYTERALKRLKGTC